MPALAYRTKLPHPDDPDILDPLYDHISHGIPLRYAAVLVGITENTAYHWVWQARQEGWNLDTPQPPGELGSHALFAQTVKEAEAAFVESQVKAWHNADGKEFAKHATFLERRASADFGRNQRIEVATTAVHVTIATYHDDVKAFLAQQLLASIGQADPPLLLQEGGGGTDTASTPVGRRPQPP